MNLVYAGDSMDSNDDLLENIKCITRILNQMKLNHLENKKRLTTMKIENSNTFKNFAIGPSSQLAYNVSLEITKNIGRNSKYPEVFIHGENGIGKTHLLNAIEKQLNVEHPKLIVKTTTAKNIMDEMISFMKRNQISTFFENYTINLDVLIVDDVQELKNKEGTQEQFLLIIKELQRTGKQIVYASDYAPKKINGISNKLLAQFQKCLVVDIQKPDLETSVLILEMIAQRNNLIASKKNLLIIAENTEHNPAQLEGALLRIKAASELMKVEITEEFIKKELSSI